MWWPVVCRVWADGAATWPQTRGPKKAQHTRMSLRLFCVRDIVKILARNLLLQADESFILDFFVDVHFFAPFNVVCGRTQYMY